MQRACFLLRMYITLQFAHLRASLSYNLDFWIGIAGMALTHGVGGMFIWTLFQRVPMISGWQLWEVAFLYALSIIPRGLAELLCDGQWGLRQMVNRGEFDRLLLRPISPVLQLITQFASIHGLGSVLLGGLILVHAMSELRLGWKGDTVLLLAMTLLSGVILVGSINLATNCLVFWEPSATSSFPVLIYQFAEFAKFPLTIYDQVVRVILIWVIPFACVTYYPGLVLLGKSGMELWTAIIAPFAGLTSALIASIVWRQSIGHYQSTGH